MLWLACLQRIREKGFKTISLWVIAANERAIGFYVATGFKPEPASLKEFTLGGARLQELRCVFEIQLANRSAGGGGAHS